MANEEMAPYPFGGIWYHTQEDESHLDQVIQNGWNLDVYTNSKYGRGIYFARCKWHESAKYALAVRFKLSAKEGMSIFLDGTTKSDLAKYLRYNNILGTTAGPANSPQNIEIQNYFRNIGIKAIRFIEYTDTEVAVVYDPSVIIVVNKIDTVNIEECPSRDFWTFLQKKQNNELKTD